MTFAGHRQMRPARVSAAPAAEKYVAAVVAKDAAHRSSAAEEEIINKRQTVRNRRVVLALFCLYAVGLGLLVVLVPSQKESLLLAGRKKNGESSSSVASFWLAGTRFRAKSGEASFLTIADLDKIQVLHCCGLAAFASISLLGILGLAISADAIKRRVSTLTLPCSLLGTFCYALLITDSTPVMVGAATGQHPVYPSKLLSWVFSTTLMMYTLWSAGETPVRFLLRGLALNAVMLLSGFTASLSDGSALHLCLFVAFGCFVGMGYHQWMFFGGDVGDHPLTHRANRAILKTKFIMATAWTAFPCIYMLQFTTVVSPVQAEALMVAADVFAKALLVCATQHGIVCMASDRMNVAMQQMAIELFEDLREQEKQKDKFFATVTNEICRPLKQMVALIDSLMLTHEGGMSKKLKDAVKTVRDSGGRLQQLVGNIVLDYSAAGKECKLRLTFEPVNFSKIVGDAVLLIEPLLRSNVSLRVNVPNDLPMIEADRNRLTQVMFNLLGSAAESTQAGEISIVASVENNVVLRVEVKDSSGASELNAKPRDSRRTKLALSLANNLVEAHDGQMTRRQTSQGAFYTILIPVKVAKSARLSAEVGRAVSSATDPQNAVTPACTQRDGNVLGQHHMSRSASSEKCVVQQNEPLKPMKYVRGLIAKAEKFRPKLGSSRLSLMETTGRKLAGGRNAAVQWLVSRKEAVPSRPTRAEVAEELPVPEVLLVDDEPTKHVSVRELLVHSGYAVTAATSTEEALRILSERFAEDGYNSFPSVILMDLEMAGHEAGVAFRDTYADALTPIIVLSAKGDEKSVVQALQNDCNDYIVRPFRAEELLARVRLQCKGMHDFALQLEARKHEDALRELLPAHVIDRIMLGEDVIVDTLEEATVLFAEVVGLHSALAKGANIRETWGMLDKLYAAFDSLADKHGVYKVEATSGRYMAVAGHDTMTRFDHAARVLRLAKEMTEIAADEMARVSHGMRIRVGIHTGKLVGVVLGGRCPRYSLHGEMLDELCLIERCGSPMRVQISEATYNAIQETEAGSDMDLVKGFRYLGEQTDPGTGLRTKVWFAELGDWKTASEPNRLPVERESLPVSKDNQTKLPYRDVAIVPEVISEEDSQSEDPDGSLEQQGLLPEDR